jgi:hypothetical protein
MRVPDEPERQRRPNHSEEQSQDTLRYEQNTGKIPHIRQSEAEDHYLNRTKKQDEKDKARPQPEETQDSCDKPVRVLALPESKQNSGNTKDKSDDKHQDKVFIIRPQSIEEIINGPHTKLTI